MTRQRNPDYHLDRFDLRKNEWERLNSDRILDRIKFAAVLHKDTIFLIGGETKHDIGKSTMASYSLTTGKWTAMRELPRIRRGVAANVWLPKKLI